jgi:hypothetical protein
MESNESDELNAENILTIALQNQEKRLCEQENRLLALKAKTKELSLLVAREEAFVENLRQFVEQAESERKAIQTEFKRLALAS